MFAVNESKKYFYLDLLRIYAILCVIMLHIAMPYLENAGLFGSRIWHIANILNTISRTGVPVFFMVSGFLLLNSPKTLNFTSFYKRRLSKLAIPFLAWNVIYYVAYGVMTKDTLSVADFLKKMLIEGTSYHFWFVYTLIIIYLFMPFLKRIVDGLEQKWCWLLLIISGLKTTIVPLINIIASLDIYLFDNIFNGYVSYVLLGYIIGRFEYTKRQRAIFYCAGFLGAGITIIGNFMLSNEGTNYVFNGGYQAGHFMLAATIFVWFKSFPAAPEKIVKVTGKLSGITFGMYLVHPMVITAVTGFVSSELRPYIYISVIFGATVVISAAFAYLVSKIKFINKILL